MELAVLLNVQVC